MVSALNFKSYDKGALRGFFDLRYHGLTVKGCRMMSSKDGTGLRIAFPQREGTDKDGNRQWFDQLYLTPPEADHLRRLVITDLQAQGHIDAPAIKQQGSRQADHQRQRQPSRRTPEGEDLSRFYTSADDDIPY